MKSDRRVKYTKMVLRNSLIQLLNEKPFEKITIKELCQRADVNRGTFYVHYNDQEDLLQQIQDELIEGMQNLCEKGGCKKSDWFKYVRENKDAVLCLYSHQATKSFAERINSLLREYLKLSVKDRGIKDEGKNEILFDYLVSGIVGCTLHWLTRDCPCDDEQLICILERLWQGTVSEFVK